LAGIAQTRQQSRRRIHDAAARPIWVYRNGSKVYEDTPFAPLKGRLHSRSSRKGASAARGQGRQDNFGNVDLVSNTDSVVLSRQESDQAGWAPKQGDKVFWPDDQICVELDMALDEDGPDLLYFTAVRCSV
jgi:hypothetical protein